MAPPPRIGRIFSRNALWPVPAALFALPFFQSPAAAAPISDEITGIGNVLILVADDLGADQLGFYSGGANAPATPNLDALAAGGLVFENAWASPIGSPTRAMLMTGRFGFRTGIGSNVGPAGAALKADELILPELLDLGTGFCWDHAAFGKWHLGNGTVGAEAAPTLAGWSYFVGSERSIDDYYSWPKIVGNTVTTETAYATTDTINEFLDWRATASEPWLAYVAFHSPRAPYHAPPGALHSVDLSIAGPPGADPRPYYGAMVESLDTEVGRLLNFLGPDVLDTTIIFLSDNGTPEEVQPPPVSAGKNKNTVFEAGVHVPLVVSGPLVASPGRSSDELVLPVDVFATVAELAGVDPALFVEPETLLDGVSFLPIVEDPAANGQRAILFTEVFAPNGTGEPLTFRRAISDAQHKLHLSADSTHLFFDVEADPNETTDLFSGTLTGPQQASLEFLAGELYPLLEFEEPQVIPLTCATHVTGSLVPVSGLPLLGSTITLGMDNPGGTQPIGISPILVLSLGSLPCGVVSLSGFGMQNPGTAPGDLLINPAQIVLGLTAPAWAGPGNPAPVDIPIPVAGALVGAGIFAQGLFSDPLGGSALTQAIELRIAL